jgi:aquaporin Z
MCNLWGKFVCNCCLKKHVAEFIGTFLLVFVGCGSAVFAGSNIGYLGVSLAFGLTLMVCAYIFGPISGCHINPAVTIGLTLANRFHAKDVICYVCFQLLGATVAGAVLYWIASDAPNLDVKNGLALTGMGVHSPGGYSVVAGFLAEVIGTFVLVFVILLATTKDVTAGFAPIIIGTTLTVLLLVFIPVTNGSFNIARSVGVALFHGGWALAQLLIFLGAHVIAAVCAAVASSFFCCRDRAP